MPSTPTCSTIPIESTARPSSRTAQWPRSGRRRRAGHPGTERHEGQRPQVRRLYGGKVLAGFAGGTADAFTLFERFEGKLEKFGNLTRAAIELAKDWRSDRSLRRLEALLCVADLESMYVISGNGDVIEPSTT